MGDPTTATLAGRPTIHAGFIPLIDCAPLVIAATRGLDAEFGFDLRLYREVSWANIRDKIAVGAYDCAHMLAPMPIAAALGLGRTSDTIIVPMALNLNGNAITVSTHIYEEMLKADAEATRAGGWNSVRALRSVIEARSRSGLAPLTFGMVFPFSSHNYDLRDWLASGGIDPDNDVNLIVIPPSLMDGSLRSRRIDGFCAGEPWNSVAVAQGDGVIIATKSQLWPRSPEKVLGVRGAWAEREPALLDALIKALIRAGRWLADSANHNEAAAILSRSEWVGTEASLIGNVLSGFIARGGGEPVWHDSELMLFHNHGADLPRHSHAMWILSQMIRWGHVHEPFDLGAVVAKVCQPQLYMKAAEELAISLPQIRRDALSTRGPTEAAPQRSSNAEHLGAAEVITYLEGLQIRSRSVDLARFRAVNEGRRV